uniref:Uncharacterized protein AlNc14C108G6281 n=1 Tax=Albugo laibachii Nc14 TaxID=890382 RepID=F0WI74_9STRA|nr:conserved hypothetical protein [Albugo laibachii Nc14]|eukprot:CCA20953.1 conserved hypothetical protein [Albugo laibachii Nc14]
MQENDLTLRFLFANHENARVILRMPPATGIGSLKATLLQHWPPDVPKVDNVSQIRFICMGRGLLQDRQTLSSARIPSFPTHPTPINVVVRSNVSNKGTSTPTTTRSDTQPIDCNCVVM